MPFINQDLVKTRTGLFVNWGSFKDEPCASLKKGGGVWDEEDKKATLFSFLVSAFL